MILLALNDDEAINRVIGEIPEREMEWREEDIEILVVDNSSTDRIKGIAPGDTARIIMKPIRKERRGYQDSL